MSSPSSQLRHIWSPLTIGSTVEAGLCDPESPLAFLTQGDKLLLSPKQPTATADMSLAYM